MLEQDLNNSITVGTESSAAVDTGLSVELAVGRQMRDLTTRGDKLAAATSLVKYDFGSLLQEFEYLQKTVTNLKLSDQDKQTLSKLAASKDSPSAADLKSLSEITDRFIKENSVLPASDAAWYQASLERLNQQQTLRAELDGQSPEIRRANAVTIRNTAIEELRTDLPAEKVAEIDKLFPDKNSKEAVQKLLELAETRNKELEASYNAEDKKTLERINLSVGAISKCDKEISECSNLVTSERQKSAGQDQRNWYQLRLAEGIVNDLLPFINPEEAKKIDLSKISASSEQLSAGLNALRASFKEFLDSAKGREWGKDLNAESKKLISDFVSSTSTEITAVTGDLIKAVGEGIIRSKNLSRDEADKLSVKLDNVKKIALDSEVHSKYLPDGIPVSDATGPSAAAYTNLVKEQFKKIDQEFWSEMKNRFLDLAKAVPDQFKSPDGKSLLEIANKMTSDGATSDEIGKALWRVIQKIAQDVPVSLDANTYSDIRSRFQSSTPFESISVLDKFYTSAERLIEKRDSLAEQTGLAVAILGSSDSEKLAANRLDQYRYYCTEQYKGCEKLLGLFAPEKLEQIKAMDLSDPTRLSNEGIKAVTQLTSSFLDTADGKDFYSKQNGFIRTQIDKLRSPVGISQSLDYDASVALGIVLNAMIETNTKLAPEQRSAAHQVVSDLRQLGLEVTLQRSHLYYGVPSSHPQTQVEKDYVASLPRFAQNIQNEFWDRFVEEVRSLNSHSENRLGFGSKIEDTVSSLLNAGKSMEEVGKALWRTLDGLPVNAPVTLDAQTVGRILAELDKDYQKQIFATNDPAAKERLNIKASSIQYELTRIVEIHDSFIELSGVKAPKILNG